MTQDHRPPAVAGHLLRGTDGGRDQVHGLGVRQVRAGPDGACLWEVEVTNRTEHSPETAYRVIVAESKLAPTVPSRLDDIPKAETRYEARAPFPASYGDRPGRRPQSGKPSQSRTDLDDIIVTQTQQIIPHTVITVCKIT